MTDRQLVFRDSAGHRATFTMGDRDHLKFTTKFNTFVKKHISAENSTFTIERELTDERLVLESAVGIVACVRGGAEPATSYRRVESYMDGSDLHVRFAYAGFAEGIAEHGPWTPDHDSLLPAEDFENPYLSWADGWRREEQRRREVRTMPKLDRKALNRFCKIWADSGYNEYPGESTVYVLPAEPRGSSREEILSLIEQLGLRLVDPAAGTAAAGAEELRIQADPRVDLELEKWG